MASEPLSERIRRPLKAFIWCSVLVSLVVALTGWRTTVRSGECGQASWYGKKFAGKPTASGEIYDPGRMTAAHRTLAFGTRVRVHRAASGQSIIVRINDRGPFIKGRIIDLSAKAAKKLGYKSRGIARVCVEVVKK